MLYEVITVYIKDSNVTVTGGDLTLAAERSTKVSARAKAVSVTASIPIPDTFSLSLGGTFSANQILGRITSYNVCYTKLLRAGAR